MIVGNLRLPQEHIFTEPSGLRGVTFSERTFLPHIPEVIPPTTISLPLSPLLPHSLDWIAGLLHFLRHPASSLDTRLAEGLQAPEVGVSIPPVTDTVALGDVEGGVHHVVESGLEPKH